ncbi:heterokaryon incompatibility protein-domain-containing protein [Hypomontagnella monticulosa]|nr:heterokaryon incompatibility protein-domain-containing protein [Hypomontagnella monticulosa]
MLCQNCQDTIKTLAEQFKKPFEDGQTVTFPLPLHYSLESFHKSVLAGCLVCGQIWTYLLEGEDATLSETLQELRLRMRGYEISVKGAKSDFGKLPELDYQSSGVVGEPEDGRNKKSVIDLSMANHDGRLFIGAFPVKHWPIEQGIRFTLTPAPKSSPTLSDPILKARHVSTGGTVNLWRHWYNMCSKTHVTCQAGQLRLHPFAPTRLIELQDDDHGNIYKWTLVCPEPGVSVPYLTLSHCWGTSKHTCLTESNYQEFLKGSPISTLPRTYQDACVVAHSLGFRYVWIDSLCIIQDSIEDWRTQSHLMHLIYKSASCNIAATWGEDGNDGCFRTVDPWIRDPTPITLDFELNGQSEFMISKSDTHHEDIIKAPLNQRGWVVQERYLARRQLGFSKHQAYWECPELIASEQLPTGIPETLWNPNEYGIYRAQTPPKKPHLNVEEERDVRKCWNTLIERYSACYLTHESDRLIAIAGLVGELQQNMKDVCLTGLWRRDLYQQLCWVYDLHHRYKVGRSATKSCVAPTWSWANLGGQIMCDTAYCEEADDVMPFVKVIDSPGNLSDQSDSQNLGVLKLSLKGIALWTRSIEICDRKTRPYTAYSHRASFNNMSETLAISELDDIGLFIHWDEVMPPPPENPRRRPSAERERVQGERSSNLLFLTVHSSRRYHWKISGLILKQLPSVGEDTYIRMGVFTADPGVISRFLAARLGLQLSNSLDDRYDLDLEDPRLADLVHTVAIV